MKYIIVCHFESFVQCSRKQYQQMYYLKIRQRAFPSGYRSHTHHYWESPPPKKKEGKRKCNKTRRAGVARGCFKLISSTGYKVEVEMQKNVSRFCVLGSMLEPDLEAWQIKPYLSKSCSSLARCSHRLGLPDMADIRGGGHTGH